MEPPARKPTPKLTAPEAAAARKFDWRAAHERLAQVAMDEAGRQQLPADEVARILRARASILARPAADAAPTSYVSLIVFVIGNKRYAFDAGQAIETVPVASITPLPGTPPFYLGLVGHRGSVFPLVDVQPLLGIGYDAAASPRYAILIAGGGRAIAVAADSIDGLARVDAASIAAASDGTARHPSIRGTTPDATLILDALGLLEDARLIVNEQPTIPARHNGGAR